MADGDRADDREKTADHERHPVDLFEALDFERDAYSDDAGLLEATDAREGADARHGGRSIDTRAEAHDEIPRCTAVVLVDETLQPFTCEDRPVGDRLRVG